MELARDYLSAGLLDRSERIFKQLLGLNTHTQEAYASLIIIYEREREWSVAIEMANQLRQKTGESHSAVIAHYYYEMAGEALVKSEADKAWSHLQRALAFDSECARANIMCGDIALGREDYKMANDCYRRVEQQDPQLVPVMAANFKSLSRQDDSSALKSFIAELKHKDNDCSIIPMAAAIVEDLEGVEAAEQFIKDELLKRPTLKGLHKWAEMELNKSNSKEKSKIRVIEAVKISV